MIERDLDKLRKAHTEPTGWAPDRQPRFVHVLAEEWMKTNEANGPRPRALPDSRFRHSDAAKCSRAISYAALDLPPSNPMDIAGHWVTGLGSLIHDRLQVELDQRYAGRAEVICIVDGFEGSGHADYELRLHGHQADPREPLVVAEFKSVGGYAYKLAVGERGEPKGPSHSYVVQGALNAVARNADELVIGLLARDVISVQAADRKNIDVLTRFCAEWTLTREQFEPIAHKEMERVSAILALLDQGQLASRKIPDPELPKGHVITDPNTGTWVVTNHQTGAVIDVGTTWHCGYCAWQDTCVGTGETRVSIEQVTRADG